MGERLMNSGGCHLKTTPSPFLAATLVKGSNPHIPFRQSAAKEEESTVLAFKLVLPLYLCLIKLSATCPPDGQYLRKSL